MNAYRIIRIADPRSRGACAWYEIEGSNSAGDRWHVATCDSRDEARELLRSIRQQIEQGVKGMKWNDGRNEVQP